MHTSYVDNYDKDFCLLFLALLKKDVVIVLEVGFEFYEEFWLCVYFITF